MSGLEAFLLTPLGLIVTALLGYAVGASIHVAIAYRTIKRESERARAETLRVIREEVLPEATTRILLGVTSSVGALRFPTPQELVDSLPAPPALPSVDDIATKVTAALQFRLASKAGAVERTKQSTLEKILLSTTTGNVYVDGLFAMVPADTKKEWARKMSRVIRTQGVERLFGAEPGELPNEEERGDGLGPEWH